MLTSTPRPCVCDITTSSKFAKAVRTADIYWGAIPFLLIQLIMVVVVLAFPQVVLRDAPADASSVGEVPLNVDPDTGFLPAEWR